MTAHRWQLTWLCLLVAPPATCADPGAPPPAIRASPDVRAALVEIRDGLAEQMPLAGVTGLSVAVVDGAGTAWLEGFGHRGDPDRSPVGTDTLFSLQSISKTFTALGVLAAGDEGLLRLDDSLARHLPGFSIHSRFGEGAEDRITLRHLLGHKAGLTHEAPHGNNYDAGYRSFEAHVGSIGETWLRFPVGERFAYSNLGYDLAGYVLQTRAGRPFPAYMSGVLERLGLSASSFDWGRIRAAADRAVGHRPGVERVPLEFAIVPSGGMYSSAADLSRFLAHLVGEPPHDANRIWARALAEHLAGLPLPLDGQTEGYGLGIESGSPFGVPGHWHNGSGFGFASHLSWYPSLGLGVAVLTNADGHALAWETARRIVAAYARGRVPPPARADQPAPVPVPESAQRALAGTYVGDIVLRFEIEDGRLVARFGQRAVPLVFLGPDEVLLRQERLRFERDVGGRPRAVTRLRDGRSCLYNGGPGQPAGPDRTEWAAYTGRYTLRVWGRPDSHVEVKVQDGHLFLDELLLDEHLPGLFFSTTGEALDFRGPAPTWANVVLEEAPAP